MYLAVYSISSAALLYFVVFLWESTTLNAQRKKAFLAAALLTFVIILAEALTIYTRKDQWDVRTLHLLGNLLGFSLAPLVPFVIGSIIDGGFRKLRFLCLLPSAVNMVLVLLSPFFQWIFYIDGENRYVRGRFFFFFVGIYVVNYLVLFLRTVQLGKKYNYPIMRKMMALSFFILVGTSIQVVYPEIYATWLCVILALLLYYMVMAEFDGSFDALTGLYSRGAFHRRVARLEKSFTGSVMMLDLNDFKEINDIYGHEYGDRVLEKVSEMMRSHFQQPYRVYRYGGDEFAILSSETDERKIEKKITDFYEALTTTLLEGKVLPKIAHGLSITTKETQKDFSTMMKEADGRMYGNKRKMKDS